MTDMNDKSNITELFDGLPSIEVSPKWEQEFQQRLLHESQSRKGFGNARVLPVIGVAFLLLLNIFALTGGLVKKTTKHGNDHLKQIAAEMLINTSSSSY